MYHSTYIHVVFSISMYYSIRTCKSHRTVTKRQTQRIGSPKPNFSIQLNQGNAVFFSTIATRWAIKTISAGFVLIEYFSFAQTTGKIGDTRHRDNLTAIAIFQRVHTGCPLLTAFFALRVAGGFRSSAEGV